MSGPDRSYERPQDGARRSAPAALRNREPIAAVVRTIFAQPDHTSAMTQLRKVADGLRTRFPRAATVLEDAAEDILAYRHLPIEHQRQLHSTNPLERLNKEIKRRADVVGIFPNEAAIRRLVGAILLEQNDEWAVQRARYLTLETMAPMSDDLLVSLPAVALSSESIQRRNCSAGWTPWKLEIG